MQIEIVNLNDLLKKNHPYRILFSMIDFFGVAKNIAHIKNNQLVDRDFSLINQTPDHSLFSHLRQSIGNNALASIFNKDIFL